MPLPLISAAEVLDSSYMCHSPPQSNCISVCPSHAWLSPKPQWLAKPIMNDQTYQGATLNQGVNGVSG